MDCAWSYVGSMCVNLVETMIVSAVGALRSPEQRHGRLQVSQRGDSVRRVCVSGSPGSSSAAQREFCTRPGRHRQFLY